MTMFDVIRKLAKPIESDVNAYQLLDMDGMRERNEQRIDQIKVEMGEKYILHASHKCGKLDTPRPV